LRDPFALHVTIIRNGTRVPIAVVPDRLLEISYSNGPRNAFALERDRGTMSIGSKYTSLFKTSIWRKLVGYWQAVQSQQHMLAWGFQSFRILTVTTSETRIANMVAAEQEATEAPPGLFLYSTLQRIADHGFLGAAWISAAGQNISLARRASSPRVSEPNTLAQDFSTETLHAVALKLLGPSLLRAD
jgi:hypothetical protein